MKIAITGTHGAGKSTLSYVLASQFKLIGKNVKIIQEVARACPFPINEGMSKEAAIWIFLEHARKELEAEKKHEIVVCDRTLYDSFVYAKHFNLFDRNDPDTEFERLAYARLQDYDKIFFVEPTMPLLVDNVRSPDEEFRNSVHGIFEGIIHSLSNVVKIDQKLIFEDKEIWKSYCQQLLSPLSLALI